MAQPLEVWTQRGSEEALETVKKRFEDQEDPERNLPFHNSGHSATVEQRTKKILEAMKSAGAPITKRDIAIGGLAGAWHDVVQEEGLEQNGKRVRLTAENEKASWEEAHAFMRRANDEAGKKIFTEEDEETVESAIRGTIPGWNQGKSTVDQPHVDKGSYVARAVAFADLGDAGMGGFKEFGPAGDALFREENLDVLRGLQNPDELTAHQKEAFRQRMLGWSKFQGVFAGGRKSLLEEELDGLNPKIQEKMRKLFGNFDDSIEGARLKAELRETMNFEELAQSMGYE